MRRFGCLLALAGCVSDKDWGGDSGGDSSDDSGTSGDCRPGMSPADPASAVVYELTLNGLSTLPAVDRLCASADGLRSELTLNLDGAAGLLRVQTSATGSFAQGDPAVQELAVQAEGLSFAVGDFYSLSLGVYSATSGVEVSVLGDATTSGGDQLTLSAAWSLPAR